MMENRDYRRKKDLDDHFEPIQTLFMWAGYAMFAAAGCALVFAGVWWAILHWKALLFVTTGTVIWLTLHLLFRRGT